MAGQGSAKISLKEIDLSQVKSIKENPTGIPAAVIGTSEKGPAFLPKTFANIQQFNEIFGDISKTNSTKFGPLGVNQWLKNSKSCTFMRVLGVGDGSKDFTGAGFKTEQELVQSNGLIGKNTYATIAEANRTITKSTFKCYAFGCFMKDVTGSKYLSSTNTVSEDFVNTFPVIRGLLFTPQGVKPSFLTSDTNYISGTETSIRSTVAQNPSTLKSFGNNIEVNIAGYEIGKISNDSFNIALNGFSNLSEPYLISCSFNTSKNNYFSNVMNTDPTLIEEKGHYLHLYWDVSSKDSLITNDELLTPEEEPYTGEDLGFIFPIEALDSWENKFETAKTPWVISQLFSKENNTSRASFTSFENNAIKLFRLHMLDDGDCGNDKYRVLVSNLRNRAGEYSTFDLSLEKFDSNPLNPVIVASWKNLNLDLNSNNFIGRVIGDVNEYFDFNLEQGQQKLTKVGTFELRNNFIRVELSDEVLNSDIPVNTIPCGFESQQMLYITETLGEDNTILKDSVFSKIIQPPVPLVKSISKISGQTIKSNSSVAWGVKFSVKQKEDIDFNETSEITFNKSISNWAKFIPSEARLENESAALVMNNLFTLEKIAVYKDENGLVDWNSAQYVKSGDLDDIQVPVIDGFLEPAIFLDMSTDATSLNSKYLKFRMLFEGGFDGVNIFDKNKSSFTDLACHREFNDEAGLNIFTGPTIETYKKALDILNDKSAAEFQILSVPGIRTSAVTDYALRACEDRFDALCLLDIEQIDEENLNFESDIDQTINVRNTISNFASRELNSSFGAAYFPDVILTNSTGQKLKVPPTVCMLGVLSQNDAIDDPWFAPAGLKRGKLDSDFACVNMNKDLLDELYDADINPIYSPAGYEKEIYVLGQKTLLNSKSALDRINVRRLLIDIRRKVKNIANTLLFEPNRESTLAKFSSLVEPIMKDVKDREGVVRYKVQIDTTTTTQNDIENNTIRGKIYLQPTKSIEFISLDFVVSNSI